MHNNDTKNAAKEKLLGELKSIIDMLDEDDQSINQNVSKASQPTIAIPVLEDVVAGEEAISRSSSILKLDDIFVGENKTEVDQDFNLDNIERDVEIPYFHLKNDVADTGDYNKQDDVDMDKIIQALVEEFVLQSVDQLETQLRERLSNFAPETIKQLAEKHLKQ